MIYLFYLHLLSEGRVYFCTIATPRLSHKNLKWLIEFYAPIEEVDLVVYYPYSTALSKKDVLFWNSVQNSIF